MNEAPRRDPALARALGRLVDAAEVFAAVLSEFASVARVVTAGLRRLNGSGPGESVEAATTVPGDLPTWYSAPPGRPSPSQDNNSAMVPRAS